MIVLDLLSQTNLVTIDFWAEFQAVEYSHYYLKTAFHGLCSAHILVLNNMYKYHCSEPVVSAQP